MKTIRAIRWTSRSPGGILESMILLNEVADKVRSELLSWPGGDGICPSIHCANSVEELRDGDERLLQELLCFLISRFPPGDLPLLEITGTDDFVELRFKSKQDIPEKLLDNFRTLTEKVPSWQAVAELRDKDFIATLKLPAASLDPPVDLGAMAKESGIGESEALMIAEGFMSRGRLLMESLSGENNEAFRAAHSLKGAGKTLRAPELAAAAREVEMAIRRDKPRETGLKRLAAAWNRVEKWYEEVTE